MLPLEGGILCLVLVAMWGSKQPERTAISIVLYTAIVSIVYNMAAEVGWLTLRELPPLIGIFELLGALSTIALSAGLRKEDRVFFFNMAKFLIASAGINFVAPLDMITGLAYSVVAYMIVVAHLLYMLRNSNGVMDIFRGVWNHIGSNDLANIDSGQRESR